MLGIIIMTIGIVLFMISLMGNDPSTAMVIAIRNRRLNLEYICPGQLLHKLRNVLRVALVNSADGIVLIGPAEINGQTLAYVFSSS